MKKIIILLLLISILQLSAINAYTVGKNGIDIVINNNTINVQSYVFLGSVPYSHSLINDSIGSPLSCLPYNSTNGTWSEVVLTNCTYTFPNKILTINLTDICSTNETNQTIIADYQLLKDLESCRDDKRQLVSNIQELGDINVTNTNYLKCNADLAVCESSKAPLQSTIDSLNKQIEDSKNTKWIYSVIALVVGAVGYGWYTGRLGGPKAKHYDENYNRGQAA